MNMPGLPLHRIRPVSTTAARQYAPSGGAVAAACVCCDGMKYVHQAAGDWFGRGFRRSGNSGGR